MRTQHEPMFCYDLASVNALARHELTHKINADFNIKAQYSLNSLYELPAKVKFEFDSIPAYFHSYLKLPVSVFPTYADLKSHILATISKLKEVTPCNYDLTYLVNGIFLGSPAELHNFWSNGGTYLSNTQKGIGLKVARIGFNPDVNEHIEF